MLSPRLTNCVECASIPVLLADIDCKLTELANNAYNNIVFSLNRPVCGTVVSSLLNYKRILLHKHCNPDYASCYSIEKIASRVKILINK